MNHLFGILLLLWVLLPAFSYAKTAKESVSLGDALHGHINVRTYGAIGSDSLDDTAAIEAAFAASREARKTVGATTKIYGTTQPCIYFPEGQYIYSGSGIMWHGGDPCIKGSGKGSVSVTIKENVFLLTVSGAVYHTFMDGIHWVGGKGVLHYTANGSNVAGHHVITHNFFENYTVAAFGNNASDQPHWIIKHNEFTGGDHAIGFALGGLPANTQIQGNKFFHNKYHVKIGNSLGGSIYVRDNDFLMDERGIREADIWIVPTKDARLYGANSGAGFLIEGNKFGGENQEADDVRILIAHEDNTGTDRLHRHHSKVFDDGKPAANAGYMSGLIIKHNRIGGVGGASGQGHAPFIRSYVTNLRGLDFSDNVHDGGLYTYIVERMGTPTDEPALVTRDFNIQLGHSRDSVQQFTNGLTNYTATLSPDNKGQAQGYTETMLSGTAPGDDANYVELLNTNATASFSTFGSAGITETHDIYGHSRGATITCSESTYSGISGTLSGAKTDNPAWLEVDLKRSAKHPIKRVYIEVMNGATHQTAMRRTITLPEAWQTIRTPFIIPPSSKGVWHARIRPFTTPASGKNDRFDVARLRVYHGRNPSINGHLRTTETGAYDGGHLVMGEHHLWFDARGLPRIKHGMPTSDTDGTALLAGSISKGIAYPGSTSLIIENAEVSERSSVFCQAAAQDKTFGINAVIPANGAFTIHYTTPTGAIHIHCMALKAF